MHKFIPVSCIPITSDTPTNQGLVPTGQQIASNTIVIKISVTMYVCPYPKVQDETQGPRADVWMN